MDTESDSDPEPEADAGDADQADVEAQIAADDLAEAEAIERNSRLWVQAITPILSIENCNPLMDSEVRDAIDRAMTEAANRLARLLRSDLAENDRL